MSCVDAAHLPSVPCGALIQSTATTDHPSLQNARLVHRRVTFSVDMTATLSHKYRRQLLARKQTAQLVLKSDNAQGGERPNVCGSAGRVS
jgi:hypothetical protein